MKTFLNFSMLAVDGIPRATTTLRFRSFIATRLSCVGVSDAMGMAVVFRQTVSVSEKVGQVFYNTSSKADFSSVKLA